MHHLLGADPVATGEQGEAGPRRDDKKHRHLLDTRKQRVDEVARGGVDPVRILEQHYQWL